MSRTKERAAKVMLIEEPERCYPFVVVFVFISTSSSCPSHLTVSSYGHQGNASTRSSLSISAFSPRCLCGCQSDQVPFPCHASGLDRQDTASMWTQLDQPYPFIVGCSSTVVLFAIWNAQLDESFVVKYGRHASLH